MAWELRKCKTTVLKITFDQDLVDAYLDAGDEFGPCQTFLPGQEFIADQAFQMPVGFCLWAWADIRKQILNIACGADRPWLKHLGVDIAGCTDWFRPVVFKIERFER